MFRSRLVLTGIVMVLLVASSLVIVVPAARGASNIYVNDTTGNDSWDGTTPTYQGGTTGPKKAIQAGIDVVDATGTVHVAEGTYTQAAQLIIPKTLSLVGDPAGSKPKVEIQDALYDGVSVQADNVTLENMWFYRLGHTNYVGNIGVPKGPAPDYPILYSGLTIRNCLIEEGRYGIYASVGDLTVEDCTFKEVYRYAVTTAGVEGTTTIQRNHFTHSSGNRQAVYMTTGPGFPPDEGAFNITYNKIYNARNIYLMDFWGYTGSGVDLNVQHNSFDHDHLAPPSSSNRAVVFYGSAMDWNKFNSVSIKDNIITNGGLAAYVDWILPSSGLPADGQIVAQNNLTNNLIDSGHDVIDPTGSFGYDADTNPVGATINMYALSGNLQGDPLYEDSAHTDGNFVLLPGSPASGAATDGTNIGAYQSTAPTVTGITPSIGTNDGVVNITDLAGTNFQAGATAKLSKTGEADINAPIVNVVDASKITCDFDLTGAATGAWNVTVTNPDIQFGTLAGGFLVQGGPANPPTLTSITPDSANNGAVVNITDLSGTNFTAGATVRLSKTGEADINATNVTVASDKKITCSFDLRGSKVGQDWKAKVTTAGGTSNPLDFNIGNTPESSKPGEPVEVKVDENTTVTFDDVDVPGNTTRADKPVPTVEGYTGLAGTSCDISTTSTFSGHTKPSLSYPDQGSKAADERLKLLHLEDGTWKDVTTAVNTTDNVISGKVSSLSEFVVAVPDPCSTWYMAEGYTGGTFDTYILIQNPNDDDVRIKVTFMQPDGTETEMSYTVAAHSRYTIKADDIPGLESAEISTKVVSLSDLGVICERTMYFNYEGDRPGGSASIGTASTSSSWYFAEGYTGGDFDTYILVQNPSGIDADVAYTFMKTDGTEVECGQPVPAHSRKTLKVDDIQGLEDAEFSTWVCSTNGVGIVAERAEYFDYYGKRGGHASMGAHALSTTWVLPEGYTGGTFDTYVLIQNPTEKDAEIKATFMKPLSEDEELAVVVPAHSRRTIKVDDVPGCESTDVSTAIESTNDVGVVVERAMYFDYNGRDGGHASIGAAGDDPFWYCGEDSEEAPDWYLAEGSAAGDFDTYVLVANPTGDDAEIRVTFMKSNGEIVVKDYDVCAYSRFTIDMRNIEELQGTDASTKIESLNGVRIAVERAQYFNYDGEKGGHDSIGASGY